MDLWKARRRYRRVSAKLKGSTNPQVVALEGQLLAKLLKGERLECEQSMLHFARKGASGRLRRAIEWLSRAALLTDRQPLVRGNDLATLQRYGAELTRLQADDAHRAIETLRLDLERLEQKARETDAHLETVGRDALLLVDALAAQL